MTDGCGQGSLGLDQCWQIHWQGHLTGSRVIFSNVMRHSHHLHQDKRQFPFSCLIVQFLTFIGTLAGDGQMPLVAGMDWFIRDISLYCYRSSRLCLRLPACIALRQIPSTLMLFHLKVFPDSCSSQARYPLIITFPARVLMKGSGACSVMDVPFCGINGQS